MSDRVTADDVTGIDEIVLTGVDVHIEALSDKGFVLTFRRPNGDWLQADMWTTRARMNLKLLSVDGEWEGVDMDDEVWK